MKTPTHSSIRVSLEMGLIAISTLAALSLMVVYLADPSIYAQSLSLTSSPTDRYPVPVTLFLVGILVLITLLILGVVHHWRWVFWLMLVAFSGAALQIPVALLQITNVLPSSDPLGEDDIPRLRRCSIAVARGWDWVDPSKPAEVSPLAHGLHCPATYSAKSATTGQWSLSDQAPDWSWA